MAVVRVDKRFLLGVLFCIGLISCGGDGGGTGAQPQVEPQDVQELSVVVNDSSTVVSVETLQAGPVTVTVKNETKDPYHLSFARLNEGVTVEEVEKKIQSEKVLELITVAGSTTQAAKPGGEAQVTVEFPEGNYIALDPEAQIPFGSFEVVAAEGEFRRPPADHEIELGDFYFKFPEEVAAGPVSLNMTNAGEQSHEVSLTRVGDKEEEGEFVLAPAPGGSIWANFDLEPGSYRVICFFPDPASGKPHVRLGMKTTFVVR